MEPLTWQEFAARKLWRTPDGQYLIMALTLPETQSGRSSAVYQVRWVDPVTRAAYPDRLNWGILIRECFWLWNTEDRVNSAEAEANRHAWFLANAEGFSVPEDTPAAALAHFYWPISKGTTRGALAIVWKDGQLVAQVLGMSRHDDETTRIGTYVEIDLTAIGVRADERDTPTLTEHLPQCAGCGAKAGSPHGEYCDQARCLVTGDQRSKCRIFGDASTAGMLTVATGGSQKEFETYFRNDAGHDCGHDCGQEIYRG